MQIPRLHPDTIDAVKNRADIYEVVSEYVVLRKRGKDYIGLCPFHDEKTPSFSVSPSKQMYYCFGCNAGGNAIKFLMDVQKRSFADVVLDLARKYQVPVQTLAPEERQELQRQISLREQLYEVLAAAGRFYQHALKKEGYGAITYLKDKRKLSDEIIQQFSLGYAPPGWETLYRYLVDSKRYPVQLVEQAGLIKPRKEGGGYYDVFRDRIIIPIHDILGRVIGFGGRTMGDDQPKYLNSPETEVFLKGKTLFGLDKAKNAIQSRDATRESLQERVIVVEGYFDAIALHAGGITNAVASLGTALSIDQVKLALRYCDSKQIILNFDADKAGVSATERAIGEIANLAYNGEVQLKILNIPDGKDPDEYLQNHSSQDYRQLLDNAPLWLDWQINQIRKDRDIKNAIDFQYISQQFVKLLNKIINIDTRNYYISHCAEILCGGDNNLIALRVENLVTQLKQVQVPRTRHKKQKPSQSNYPQAKSSSPIGTENILDRSDVEDLHTFHSTDTSNPSAELSTPQSRLLEQSEGLLLGIYLHYPQYRQFINRILEENDLQFSLSHHRYLWQQILEIPDRDNIDLISRIQNIYLEAEMDVGFISHLFYLSEKAKREIMRTPQVIQAATVCMEKILREKRKHHFRKILDITDYDREPEQWQSYYESFIYEETKLRELNRLRLFSIVDLM